MSNCLIPFDIMYDYNSMMALKELIVGEEERDLVQNPCKGSMLDPGAIGPSQKRQVAPPNTKVEATLGEKYVAKAKVASKYAIWSPQEIKELPEIKNDPRKQPQFQCLYRQKVGTEDVFLGLSGVDPTSNSCQQMLYRINLPHTPMKDIQIDLDQRQLIIQSSKYYLAQHFQYRMEAKSAKAKLIADKGVLQITLNIVRDQ